MEELKDDIQIDIRSEEVQEIMGQLPSWLLRWGIVVIAGILSLFLVISCFFKIPQSLSAQVQLTTSTPPVELHTYSEGQLEYIAVTNKQSVTTGQILAIIKNSAESKDIMKINSLYIQWKNEKLTTDSLLNILHKKDWQTGELQSSFFAFIQSLENYEGFLKRNYYPRKIALKREEQRRRRDIEQYSNEELQLNKELFSISYRVFVRDSVLFSRNIGSIDSYDKSYITYLQNRKILLDNQQIIKETELKRTEEEETELDLKNLFEEALSNYRQAVQTACNQWEIQMNTWERTYILRSPVNGIVNFMGIRSANQYVTTGELIFIILPQKPDTPIGRALLPASGAGKVEVGQKVYVRLDNYPDKEYGFLTGHVSSISEIPDNENNYFVEIKFSNGLKTNYHKSLPLSKQMVGTAQIIVDDKRLIENIVEPISKIIREHI